ncbi:MAG: hypothetical protein FJ320_02595 [SAR202 cluster bacterium]|nr:hypothetical protein [SAR202 cluster bacterium]
MGAVVASLCCLPGAAAVAIGTSAGTAASLYRLQDYQRLAQIVGLAIAGIWILWLVSRSRKACSIEGYAANRQRVPLLVLVSFTGIFAVLNLLVIPLLEG